MIKVYHSANLDAINWKIYVDNSKKELSFLPSNTSAIDAANQLCQFNLFESDNSNKVYVVNVDSWKLADEQTKQCIRELHSVENKIILVIESPTVKNKIFNELDIEIIKATAVTKKNKALLIHQLLVDLNIKLQPNVEQAFVDLLPEKIDFIQNEIKKLQLMDQTTFSEEEIKQLVFDLGDATVFNVVDSWLNGNEELTIERLNDLISKNITIQAFVPIFALKLVQIKFFLMAKLAHWSSEVITAKQSIPFWQQRIYGELRPYDEKLEMINAMLDKLYQFDINVKKQKNIPYTQLIKILFN